MSLAPRTSPRDPAARLTPLERMAAVNRERLKRARSLLTTRQQDFLDVLPYLFHVNHPQLPGWAGADAPAGVHGYAPDGAALAAARRLARGHSFVRRALARFEIHGLYLMGSCGSVAQSETSDLDVWVCHPPGLDAARLGLLDTKARAIETFAAGIDLEVHFFVFDAASFRAGRHQSLSTESSGSSQHCLLLDEFYRSGLVLGGLWPDWLLRPPGGGAVQEQPGAAAARVDFGELDAVPAEEYFGAAVWHLYKSLDSPYKSLLKLLLIESYAHAHPEGELLAHAWRRAMHLGETDLDSLDPYVRMYRRVEAHLEAQGDAERLALARRAFYFKVGERLSEPGGARETQWRRALLHGLCTAWGWSEAELERLDHPSRWRFHAVREEHRILTNALTRSYRALSDFARRNGGASLITQADLNALGRRLYAAFERKPGKLELLNRGLVGALVEERVSLHLAGTPGIDERWLLYFERIGPEDTGAATPVRRSASLLDLLAWCHFNRLVDARTLVYVFAPGTPVGVSEVRAVLEALETAFPGGALPVLPAESFSQPATTLQALCFVNLGVDALRLRGSDRHLTTERNNALSYGGLHENLAQSFDLIEVNSWGEVSVHRFTGAQAMGELLVHALGSGAARAALTVHCVGSSYAPAIVRRVQEVIEGTARCFAGDAGPGKRFLLEVGRQACLVQMQGTRATCETAAGTQGAIALLGRPQPAWSPVFCDAQSFTDTALPSVLAANRHGVVQVVLQPRGEDTLLYVLDENGALFVHEARIDDRNAFLEQYQRFFGALRRRRAAEGAEELVVEFHLLREERGERRLVRLGEEALGTGRRGWLEVQVLVGADAGGRHQYLIVCDGEEYAGAEGDADLHHRVAERIRRHRVSGAAYPVYITDLALDGAARRVAGPDTLLYLAHKRRIEEQLSRALRAPLRPETANG